MEETTNAFLHIERAHISGPNGTPKSAQCNTRRHQQAAARSLGSAAFRLLRAERADGARLEASFWSGRAVIVDQDSRYAENPERAEAHARLETLASSLLRPALPTPAPLAAVLLCVPFGSRALLL